MTSLWHGMAVRMRMLVIKNRGARISDVAEGVAWRRGAFIDFA